MSKYSIHPSWLNPDYEYQHDDGFDNKEYQQCTNCDAVLYLEDIEVGFCPMCDLELVSLLEGK